jgi:hypothetical protein
VQVKAVFFAASGGAIPCSPIGSENNLCPADNQLKNPGAARWGNTLGKGSGWLFLILLSLCTRLDGQVENSYPSSHKHIHECVACDSIVAHSTLVLSRLEPQNQQKPTPYQQKKKAQNNEPETNHSPGHIFWVVPAFKVEYGQEFQPLSVKEKFQEWARGAYDPLGLGAGAAEAATLEHSSKDGFCGYGAGWSGYGKCFGSLELDATISSFIGDFALTSLWHQDPRYFRLGKGSFGRRAWYAISRVFVTFNDSGRPVFFTSALTGTVAAAGISNLYYPQQDRGFGHTLSRISIDLGNTALYNAAAEFWPDIHRVLHRKTKTKPGIQ